VPLHAKELLVSFGNVVILNELKYAELEALAPATVDVLRSLKKTYGFSVLNGCSLLYKSSQLGWVGAW
jgi:hypothetical protein